MGRQRGLSKKTKELKASILAELAAEKQAAPPELSDEPNFDVVRDAYEHLVQTNTEVESIETTVDQMKVFIQEVFEKLVGNTMETLNVEVSQRVPL